MSSLQRLYRQIASAASDEGFLRFLKYVETWVSKILSLAMVIVLLMAIIHLFVVLLRELTTGSYIFFERSLIEIFGLFLNILIALEILENVTAYLRKHVIQLELVIATSLTAVARKIILFDFEKHTGVELIGLALAVIALAIGYWIVRHTTHEQRGNEQ